jgi:hypothetical protein
MTPLNTLANLSLAAVPAVIAVVFALEQLVHF